MRYIFVLKSILIILLLFVRCTLIRATFSSSDICDPKVKIKTLESGYLKIHFNYYTKSFLDSLSKKQLQSIDSSLNSDMLFPGVGFINSDETNATCKDIRNDTLNIYRINERKIKSIDFNTTKYLRDFKEGFNSTGMSDIETVCQFLKTIRISLYQKPADTFYVSLETEVPTMFGGYDNYQYLWRVILLR
jgi:hypothetical protein